MAEALAAADEALGLSSELLDCLWVPELHRIKGDCKRRSQQVVAAEAHFRTALDLAVERRTRTFALRAGLGLGDLLAAGGRDREALAVLEPLVAAFPAAAETPELRAARARLAVAS